MKTAITPQITRTKMLKIDIQKAILIDALQTKRNVIKRAMTKEANITIAEIREREIAELDRAIASIADTK